MVCPYSCGCRWQGGGVVCILHHFCIVQFHYSLGIIHKTVANFQGDRSFYTGFHLICEHVFQHPLRELYIGIHFFQTNFYCSVCSRFDKWAMKDGSLLKRALIKYLPIEKSLDLVTRTCMQNVHPPLDTSWIHFSAIWYVSWFWRAWPDFSLFFAFQKHVRYTIINVKGY